MEIIKITIHKQDRGTFVDIRRTKCLPELYRLSFLPFNAVLHSYKTSALWKWTNLLDNLSGGAKYSYGQSEQVLFSRTSSQI